jgi:hypothetical protein
MAAAEQHNQQDDVCVCSELPRKCAVPFNLPSRKLASRVPFATNSEPPAERRSPGYHADCLQRDLPKHEFEGAWSSRRQHLHRRDGDLRY